MLHDTGVIARFVLRWLPRTAEQITEVVRAVLKIEMAKLLLRRLDAEGLGGTHEGTTGSTRP